MLVVYHRVELGECSIEPEKCPGRVVASRSMSTHTAMTATRDHALALLDALQAVAADQTTDPETRRVADTYAVTVRGLAVWAADNA